MNINLPNALTLLRIFLVPFLVVVLLTKFEGREIVALAIFLRRRRRISSTAGSPGGAGEITTLGTLLDPIADKLLISAAFISLVELNLAPAWMVVVVVGREFAVTGLRSIAAEQGIVISASGWGKAKMTSQITAVSLLILSERYEWILLPGKIALWIVVAVAIISGSAVLPALPAAGRSLFPAGGAAGVVQAGDSRASSGRTRRKRQMGRPSAWYLRS